MTYTADTTKHNFQRSKLLLLVVMFLGRRIDLFWCEGKTDTEGLEAKSVTVRVRWQKGFGVGGIWVGRLWGYLT